MPRKRARKRTAYKRTPEGNVLHAVLDLLLAKRILAFRQNTGCMPSTYKGKSRFVRFGTPGQADIIAFVKPKVNVAEMNYVPPSQPLLGMTRDEMGSLPHGAAVRVTKVQRATDYPVPLWIEVKSESGRQTPQQLSFQKIVEDDGHFYLLVNNIDVLIQWLKEKGL